MHTHADYSCRSARRGSLVWISLSYSGFNAAVYVAGEAKDAERNAPRSLLMGTAVVTVLYVALNAAFVYLPRSEAVVGREDVAAAAAQAIGGQSLAVAIRIIIVLALTSSVFSLVMAGPRVYAKMADDGVPLSLRRSYRARHHDVDRLGGRIKRDVRLAASQLGQHLRDLVIERSLVHAIVGALTQHERLDHRPQRVWLEIVGRQSDGGDLRVAAFPFKLDRDLALVLHVPQPYSMSVARVARATADEHRGPGRPRLAASGRPSATSGVIAVGTLRPYQIW